MTKQKKNIVLAVCGGIATYKAIEIASSLRKKDFNVRVLMTQSATKFITPLTFEAITKNPVSLTVFPNNNNAVFTDLFPHLYPATEASIFIIVPATANIIGKIANGIADDIVSTSAISLKKGCLKLFCPAMNINMWNQETVQINANKMIKQGWKMIGPEKGTQACGDTGYGILSKPTFIINRLEELLIKKNLLKNKQILIFSGPTIEPIDPVRFIGNHSSGKMGKAIAQEALTLGATVTMITGPVSQSNLPDSKENLSIIKINTANEMLKSGLKFFKKSDIIIFAAAVADYAPVKKIKQKISSKKPELIIHLKNNPDIAKTLSLKKSKKQITIGFALEISAGKLKATEKLKRKNLDAVILNSPSSFNNDSGSFHFLSKSYLIKKWGEISKQECAENIFKFIINEK